MGAVDHDVAVLVAIRSELGGLLRVRVRARVRDRARLRARVRARVRVRVSSAACSICAAVGGTPSQHGSRRYSPAAAAVG